MAKIEKKPTPAVIPCPAALISAYDKNGRPNAMTAAWIANVCHLPPTIAVAIRPSRFTYHLIEETGVFVVNLPNTDNVWETDYFGVVSGRDEDKFEKTGFTPIKGSKVNAPLIDECPICIECKVVNKVHIGTHDLFIGEVLAVHYDEKILEKGRPDPLRANILTYASGHYFSLKESLGTFGYSTKKE